MSYYPTGTFIDQKYFLSSLVEEQEQVFTYQIWHMAWEQPLLLKIVRPDSEAERENLRREAKAWVDLGIYPNLLSAYFLREMDGNLLLFLESLSGVRLSEIQAHFAGLEEFLALALEITHALSYLHTEGILYNNLLSENILVDKYGRVKFMNLRWARWDGLESLTKGLRSNIYNGSPGILPLVKQKAFRRLMSQPPEYFTEKNYKLDPGSDIYALGILFYELLSQELPFALEEEAESLFAAFKKKKMDSILLSAPSIPEKLRSLVQSCLDIHPAARPKDVGEILRLLEEIYEGHTGKPYVFESWHDNVLLSMSLNNSALGQIDEEKWLDAEKILKEIGQLDTYSLAAPLNRNLLKLRLKKLSMSQFLAQIDRYRKIQEAPVLLLSAQSALETGSLTAEVYHHSKKSKVAEEKLLLAKAELSYRLGYYQEARDIYKEEVKKHSTQEVWYRFGATLLALKLNKDAKSIWEEGLKQNIPLWDLMVSYSMLLAMQGSWATARGYLDNAMQSAGQYFRYPLGNSSWSQVRNLRVLEHGAILEAVISKDNRYILARSADGESHVWEWPSGKKCKGAENLESLASSSTGKIDPQKLAMFVSDIAMSQDFSVAVTANGDSLVRLWDGQKDSCFAPLAGHSKTVTTVAITPDGKMALSGSMDKTLRLWDLTTKTCLCVLQGHEDCVLVSALSEDGAVAISSGWDKTVRVWCLKTQKCIALFEKFQDISALALSVDGRLAVAADAFFSLSIWNIPEQKLLGVVQGHRSKITSVAFSQDARFILSSSIDGSVSVYENIAERACPAWSRASYLVASLPAPIPLALRQEAFLLEREVQELLKKQDIVAALSLYQNLIRLKAQSPQQNLSWELTSKVLAFVQQKKIVARKLQDVFPVRIFLHDSAVLSFACENEVFYSITERGTLKRYYLERNQSDLFWQKPSWKIRCLAFEEKGRCFGFSGEDRILHLWRMDSDVWLEMEGHPSPIESLQFFDEGKKAISGSRNGMVQFWDLEKQFSRTQKQAHESIVSALAKSRDSHFILSAGLDGKICAWDALTEECLLSSQQKSPPILSLTVGQGEEPIWISGAADGTIRQWSGTSGLCYNIIKAASSAITAITACAQGKIVFFGTQKGGLFLWDLERRLCLWKKEDAHEQYVRQVFLSEDLSWAYSASQDASLKIWKINWDWKESVI